MASCRHGPSHRRAGDRIGARGRLRIGRAPVDAEFRVAPGEALTRETTEVEVLVTEMACNSGEDAQGRIPPPQIFAGADSLTVVVTVRPRGGAQDCQSNPETPFLLELAEPLGDRLLLDGSSVPARDATTCPDAGMCS